MKLRKVVRGGGGHYRIKKVDGWRNLETGVFEVDALDITAGKF